MIARGHGLAHLVHQAFAISLHQTFAVAADLSLIAAITVLTFLRPTHPHPHHPPAPASPTTGHRPRHPLGLMTHIRQADA